MLNKSKLILRELFRGIQNIIKNLVVSIDLKGPTEVKKKAIMGELDKILDKRMKKKSTRLKWLPKVDELLEVWDLYDQAGQNPAKKTFKQIQKGLADLFRPSRLNGIWRIKKLSARV